MTKGAIAVVYSILFSIGAFYGVAGLGFGWFECGFVAALFFAEMWLNH